MFVAAGQQTYRALGLGQRPIIEAPFSSHLEAIRRKGAPYHHHHHLHHNSNLSNIHPAQITSHHTTGGGLTNDVPVTNTASTTTAAGKLSKKMVGLRPFTYFFFF